MQWTPDRNAGFSTSDPGKLYLPVVQSLVSNFNHVNVEAQLAQPTSLLHWVHGMLAVRKRHPALGLGEFRAIRSDSEAVLAFLRTTPDETILVVANMASTARSATLELPDRRRREGRRRVRRCPVPLGGRRRTPGGHTGLA